MASLISSPSSSVNTPCSSASSRMMRSSSVVVCGAFSRGVHSGEMRFTSAVTALTMGVNTHIIVRRGPANARTSESGRSAAMILGSVSPKVIRSSVVTTVATASPFFRFSIFTKNMVAVEEAAMFTRLLPTRMVESDRV